MIPNFEEYLAQLEKALEQIKPTKLLNLQEMFGMLGGQHVRHIQFSDPLSLVLYLPSSKYQSIIQQLESASGIVNLRELLQGTRFVQTLVHRGTTRELGVFPSIRGTFWNEFLLAKVKEAPKLVEGQSEGVQFAQLPVRTPQTGVEAQRPLWENVVNLVIYRAKTEQLSFQIAKSPSALEVYQSWYTAKPLPKIIRQQLLQFPTQAPKSPEQTQLPKPTDLIPKLRQYAQDRFQIQFGARTVGQIPQQFELAGRKFAGLAVPLSPARVHSLTSMPLFLLPKPATFEEVVRNITGQNVEKFWSDVEAIQTTLNRSLATLQEQSGLLQSGAIDLEKFRQTVQPLLQPLAQYRQTVEQLFEQTLDPRAKQISEAIEAVESNFKGLEQPTQLQERLRAQMDFISQRQQVNELAGLSFQYLTKFGQPVLYPSEIINLLASGQQFALYAPIFKGGQMPLMLEVQNAARVRFEQVVDAFTRAWLRNTGKANEQRLIEADLLKQFTEWNIPQERQSELQRRLAQYNLPPFFTLTETPKQQLVFGHGIAHPAIIIKQSEQQEFVWTTPLGAQSTEAWLFAPLPQQHTPAQVSELGEQFAQPLTEQKEVAVEVPEQLTTEMLLSGQQPETQRYVIGIRNATRQLAEPFQIPTQKVETPQQLEQVQRQIETATTQISQAQQQIMQESELTNQAVQQPSEPQIVQPPVVQEMATQPTEPTHTEAIETPPIQPPFETAAHATETAQQPVEEPVEALQKSLEEAPPKIDIADATGDETLLGRFLRTLQNTLFGTRTRQIATIGISAAVTAIQLTGQAQRRKVRRDIQSQVAKQQQLMYNRNQNAYTTGAVRVQVNTFGNYYEEQAKLAYQRTHSFGRTEISVNRYGR